MYWKKKNGSFYPKKIYFIFLICWGTILLTSIIMIFNFTFNISSLITTIIGLMAVGLLIWVWFGTAYKVDGKYIYISYGPFKEKVRIAEIREIDKRKSILITPALSVDRLLLKYGRYGEILISPKNENDFINLILAYNPRITLNEKLSKP